MQKPEKIVMSPKIKVQKKQSQKERTKKAQELADLLEESKRDESKLEDKLLQDMELRKSSTKKIQSSEK